MDYSDEYGEPQASPTEKTSPEDEHDWTVDRYWSTWICHECETLYRTGCDKKGYSDDPDGSEYLCRLCYERSDENDDNEDPFDVGDDRDDDVGDDRDDGLDPGGSGDPGIS